MVGENEATSGRVTEALSHVARLTQLVRRQTGFGGQEDPTSTDDFEEEYMKLLAVMIWTIFSFCLVVTAFVFL